MAINWVLFLNDYNIHYVTTGPKLSRQGWVGVRCPFCNSNSESMGLSLTSGATSCWKCGKHSPLDTMESLLRVPRSEVMPIYRKYLTGSTTTLFKRKRTIAGASSVSLPSNSLSDKQLHYLTKRGFTDYHINNYDLRNGGIVGDWGMRIIIPIIEGGQIVSATGRTVLRNVEPKYWTLPPEKEVVHHKHTLLNWELAEIPILVEGPLDSVKGGPGFVSPFGAQMTDEQLLLFSTKKEGFIMLDNDDTGKRMAHHYGSILSTLGMNIELLWLSDYKDVGEMPLDEIDGLRKDLGLEEIYR